MPIYSYKCENCGHSWERLSGVISEQNSLHCPHCKSQKAKRTISTFNTTHSSAESPSSSLPSCASGTCELI